MGGPGSGMGSVKIWCCVVSNTKSLLLSFLWISCHLQTFFTPWWCLLKSRANLQQPKRPPRREGKISRPDGKVPCWPPSRPPPSSETIKMLRNEYQTNLRRMRPELGQDKSNFLVVLARNNLFLKRIEKNYLPTLSFISRQGGSNFQVECKKPRILFQLKRPQNWPYLSQ